MNKKDILYLGGRNHGAMDDGRKKQYKSMYLKNRETKICSIVSSNCT
jgi:hypothetical protein